MAQVSDGEEKTPGHMDAGAQRHRRTFGRAIPWLDARQQSQPPFHPARGRYRKGVEDASAITRLWVRQTYTGVAKDRSFFVQRMGSTLLLCGLH
jgi:hypothetical protein